MENEIKISSLEEYIKAINGNCIEKNELFPKSLDKIWFRGEPNIYPNVAPSLFRGDFNNGNGVCVMNESDLIESAIQSSPDLFLKCTNAIERLVTMQHYTLPTRLLDITKNPLVALFFACFENRSEEGRVLFVKQEFSKERDLNIVATIIECWGYNDTISINDIYNLLKYNGLTIGKEDNFKSYLKDLVTKHLFYLPKYNNQRIVNQRGAVICAPLFQTIDEDNLLQKRATDLRPVFDEKYFKIERDFKDKIIQELDNYGINEAFIYPEFEYQMKSVKERVLMKNAILQAVLNNNN